MHLNVLLTTVQISKHTYVSFDFLTFLLQTDSVFGYVLWMTIYTLVCSQIILGTKFSTMPPYGYTVHTANDIAHSGAYSPISCRIVLRTEISTTGPAIIPVCKRQTVPSIFMTTIYIWNELLHWPPPSRLKRMGISHVMLLK